MKFGITRWKMVPLYSGTACMVLLLTGFFQSLVPWASPTKLATVLGALSGKSWQVSLPAVVLKTAVGWADFVTVVFLAAGLVCAAANVASSSAMIVIRMVSL